MYFVGQIMGYVIVFSSFFILYRLFKLILFKVFVKKEKQNMDNSIVNFFSAFLSISIIGFGIYSWINSTLENDDLKISNFKIGKSVIERKQIDDILENDPDKRSKTEEKLYVYFSFDLENKGDNIKNFTLFNELILNDFNKMKGSETVFVTVGLYDNSKKPKVFNDIELFKENETLKGYGYFTLDDEKIKWFTDNISFDPGIIFKSGGRNSSDEDISGTIPHEIDLSELKENVLSSYKDPNTITLEYYLKKNKWGSKNNRLKKNIWSEELLKMFPSKSVYPNVWDDITPQDMIDYLYIK
jgi:hypothetical protein